MGPLTIKSDYIADSFEQSKKNKDDTLVIESCRTSHSRTGCGMVNGKIVSGKPIPVFVKFTPCKWYDDMKKTYMYGTTLDASKMSPSYSEIQFFKLLKLFHDKGICDTFVKSYNSDILKDDITMVKGFTLDGKNRVYSKVSLFGLDGLFHPNALSSDIFYTMLITEPLKRGFTQFGFWIDKQQAEMRKLKATPDEMKAAVFQLVYAISCMSSINMAHMDLHFGNVFMKIDERLRGKYKAYEFRNHRGEYETAYLPAHVIVKIIDLDGAYKFKAGDDVAPEFRKHIPNAEFTGDRVKRHNPRANIMKIMYHLRKYPHMSKAYEAIVNASGKIPFVGKDIRNPLQQIMKWNDRNNHAVDHYGVFINEKGEMINMGNDFVKTPPELLHLLAKGDFTAEKPITSSVSQRRIFAKTPAKKPKPAKTPAKKPKPASHP